MRKIDLCFLLMLAGLSLVLAAPALAQNQPPPPPLTANIPVPPLRSYAPLPLEVSLTWRRPNLLRGRLVMDISDGAESLLTYTSDELALSTGLNRTGLLLPPVNASNLASLVMDVRFVGEKRTYGLGRFPLSSPSGQQRTLVMANVVPRDGRVGSGGSSLYQLLKLERFFPQGGRSPMLTYPVRVTAGQMPGTAMGFCSYDMVVLRGAAMNEVRAGQYSALMRWVRAGGAVCVVPGDFALSDAARDFVNMLRTMPAGPQVDGGLEVYQPGLGRALLASSIPEVTGGNPGELWRDATAYLWSARADQMESMVGRGRWVEQNRPLQPRYNYYEQFNTTQPDFSWQPLVGGGILADWLLPAEVRIIPFSVVVLILIAFVLVIGPLDYFVLGALRLRKLTWIVFPVVSVAFTLFTVVISQYYMGGQDHRNAIVFVDLDPDGTVLRESRYELIFTAKHRTVETEVSSASLVSLDKDRFAFDTTGGMYDEMGEETSASEIVYTGRYPTLYATRQRFNQWSPEMNRRFLIDGETPGPVVDWRAAATADVPSDDAAAERLKEAVVAAMGPDCDVMVVLPAAKLEEDQRGNTLTVYTPGLRYLHRAGVIDARKKQESEPQWNEWEAPQGYQEMTSVEDFIRYATGRPQHGIFSVLGRVAPSGGPHFEDIALLDPSDTNDYVVLIAVPDGDDVRIYRYHYEGAD